MNLVYHRLPGRWSMARSTTKIIRSGKLLADPVLGSIIVRLMMSVNDIGVANAALNEWFHTDEKRKAVRREGGKLYYGRMQMGHIYEALLVIKEIVNTPNLRAYVDRCDATTVKSFSVVEAFLRSADYKTLLRLRNNAAFHYDAKLTLRYLQAVVDEAPDHTSPYTLGTEPLDWYFEVADLVVDQIVVREIFNIKGYEKFEQRRDEIMDRFHQLAVAFLDFAGHFIRQHV
jgi:hypothetical protein